MSTNGLVTDGEGWFVVNARESRWREEGPLGSYCTFEGKRRFPHFGINISVLEPGETMGMYHRENGQEAFLVLAGECTLIVEGEERRLGHVGLLLLRAGDPTPLVVAAGRAICRILAVGARRLEMTEASLYDRLGGAFAIAAVIDHFSDAVVRNPIAGQGSKDPELDEWSRNDLARLPGLKFMRTLWVCEIAGGPQGYGARNLAILILA